MDVGQLKAGDFEPLTGETFRLHHDGGVLDMVLVSVRAGLRQPEQARHPFTLAFLGPQEPVLPQRIYHFEHPELGEFEIFIVPIGRDEAGVRYEAVFG